MRSKGGLSANTENFAIVITFHFLAVAKQRRESGVLRSPFCVYCVRLWQAAFTLALPKISDCLCLRMRNRERLPPLGGSDSQSAGEPKKFDQPKRPVM
jgi:hypothetical protein